MNLSFLNSFLAVAASGSFTAAAQDLFITQPAVSQHIQALEEELGVRLFIRRGRGTVLTEEGKVLRAKTEDLMRTLDDVRTRLQDTNELRRGRIHLAVTELAVYLLPPVLLEFKKRYPGIEVVMTCTSTPKVLRMVTEGDADYGIARKTAIPSQKVRSHLVHNERLVLAAPSWHPLAGVPHVRPHDLEGEILALRERGAFTREFSLSWFKDSHLPESTIEATSMAAMRELVLQGCVGFLPEGVIRQEIQDGRLVILPTRATKMTMEYHNYFRKGEVPSKALNAFLCLLADSAQFAYPANIGCAAG